MFVLLGRFSTTSGCWVLLGSELFTEVRGRSALATSAPSQPRPDCARNIAGVNPDSFLKSLIKCEVLGKPHSSPISEIGLVVEMSSSFALDSR